MRIEDRGKCSLCLREQLNVFSHLCVKKDLQNFVGFQRRRRHMHYLDMLTRQFNKELLADQQHKWNYILTLFLMRISFLN